MELSFGEWIGLSVRGVWMDLSLTGYILGVVGLLLSILFFAGEKVLRKIFSYFSLVLLILFTGILVADLELYRNWGFRIDGTPLLYLKTPGEAMASVKVWLMVLLLLLAGSVVFISYKLLLKFAFSKKYQIEQGKWWMVPILLFLTATMIIPVRGGFGIAPMNPGKVYFSQNIFANHAALNGIWNLMYGLSKSADMYRQYPNRVSTEEAQVWRSAKFESQGNSHKILKSEKPNVVIILLESFGSKLIEPLGGMAGVTPNFNRLTREGLLFTNIFASGDRSDKGIVSVLSGFPAQSTQSIIKFPLKSAKLSTISEAFDSIGYSTTFYYGGDPDFANIRSYLYSAKFRKLVTQDDFPKSYRNSKWG
ncbi:MAG TPA: sulfatase-like hydrolase/transferase, partial [Tenuifilaceae bacterium]|nr:sulfatase-like hydrolase/transferase [Tenuifilaceae bacterium]